MPSLLPVFLLTTSALSRVALAIPYSPPEKWQCEYDLKLNSSQFGVNIIPWWALPNDNINGVERDDREFLAAVIFYGKPSAAVDAPGCTSIVQPFVCPIKPNDYVNHPASSMQNYTIPDLGITNPVVLFPGRACLSRPPKNTNAPLAHWDETDDPDVTYVRPYAHPFSRPEWVDQHSDRMTWAETVVGHGEQVFVVGEEVEKFAKGRGGQCRGWGIETRTDGRRMRRDVENSVGEVWPRGTATGGIICWFNY